MQGEHRGVLLLAAEPAAGLGLDDLGAVVVEEQRALHRLVDVVRALERAVDRDAAIRPGHGDHRVVLDVELLLVTDPVLALDDEIGAGHGRIDVSGDELVVGEDLLAQERVEDRLQRRRPKADVGASRAQGRPIRRRDEGDRLGLVADLAPDRDEDRLIVVDEAHDVRAGDVVGRDDDDRIPGEVVVEVDPVEPSPRLGRADGGPVPRPGEDEVIRVQGDPGELGRTLPAKGRDGRPAGRSDRGRADLRRGATGACRRRACRSRARASTRGASGG